MRTLLAGERETSRAARVEHHLKVEVQDADDIWRDWTAYVEGARWGEANEPAVSQASVRLRREGGGKSSLAPLMIGSPLNVHSGGYAPAIDKGRRIRISTATVAPGTAVTPAHYREGFRGRIDEVSWESSPIVLSCSDEGAWLLDTQIEAEQQYGTAGGQAVQTATQNILNAWPSGKGVPTLHVPVDPLWQIKTYTQARTKVLEAVRELWSQIGWDLRYRYDALHDFRLTAYDPDRDSTAPAHATIEQHEYTEVRKLNFNLGPIRNAGKVSFSPAGGGVGAATHSEPASISRYGRRYLELPPAKNIDTQAEADKYIQAVVSDLADSGAEQEIETHFLWFIQLHDRYTFAANGTHYDQDQTWAVVGYEHSFDTPATGKTTIRVAGRIVGAYDTWIRLTHVPRGRVPTIEPRSVIEPTLKDTIDVYARLFTETGEQVGLRFKENESSPVIWTMVTGLGSETLLYVDSGTEVGGQLATGSWFWNGLPAGGGKLVEEKLNNISLARDQVTKRYLQAVSRQAALASMWIPVALDIKEQPWLESVDLVFNDVDDRLYLTVVGGARCASVAVAIDDDQAFGSPRALDTGGGSPSSPAAIGDGEVKTFFTTALGGSDRNKRWYAKATPYNQPAGGGLAGEEPQAMVFVPSVDLVGLSELSDRFFHVTRTLPTTAGNYVEIGRFSLTHGAHNIYVGLTVADAGFSIAKQYLLPIQYDETGGGVWKDAYPLSGTGPYGANEIMLEVNVATTDVRLRIRRTSGATAGTALVSLFDVGGSSDSFTPMTGTGASVANPPFRTSMLTQEDGLVSVVGSMNVVGSSSADGKLTANRVILPVGVDKWAT